MRNVFRRIKVHALLRDFDAAGLFTDAVERFAGGVVDLNAINNDSVVMKSRSLRVGRRCPEPFSVFRRQIPFPAIKFDLLRVRRFDAKCDAQVGAEARAGAEIQRCASGVWKAGAFDSSFLKKESGVGFAKISRDPPPFSSSDRQETILLDCGAGRKPCETDSTIEPISWDAPPSRCWPCPPRRLPRRTKRRMPDPRRPHPLLAQMQDELCDVAAEVGPTVVTIVCVKIDPKTPVNELSAWNGASRGSGVIIDPRGWILTNNHVVVDADRIIARLRDGREFRGRAFRDPYSDLALIKIDAPTPLPAARLGDSDKVKIGQFAITVGSPFKYEGSVGFGIISGLSRRLTIPDPQRDIERVYPNMIQTDAPINSGNSGGPLCNIEGEVVAISTATQLQDASSVGIGFAIPINTAKFVIKDLMEVGRVRYGWLGISLTDVTPPVAVDMKVADGAVIDADPLGDSPAYKAGIRAGDVVTALDATPVHCRSDIYQIISQTPPKTQVRVKILRKAQEMTLIATVAEAPNRAQTDNARLKPPLNRIGLDVEPLTKKVAERNHLPNLNGVVITKIDPNSDAAANEHITGGVVILRVNDTDTPTVAAYKSAIDALKPGSQARLICQTERERKVIILPVD